MALGKRSTAEDALGSQSLEGKTAIVTGATAGIGVESARVLAKGGASVVLAVRNVKAGEELAQRFRADGGRAEVLPLDLSDLESVRAFAKAWGERPLHILLNNAGVMATPKGETKQGFETQVGTNHLGHFLLTTLLLPQLQPGARVVSVSSDLHRAGKGARLLAAVEKQPTSYSPFGAYGDSKLANVLFTQALAKRLPDGVDAFSLHPGVINTSLSRHMTGPLGAMWRSVASVFMKSIAQGAATSVYGAVAPELKGRSGAYLADCAVINASRAGRDAGLAEKLWAASERAVQA